MILKEEDFSIDLQNNKLVFTGKLEKADYSNISSFLAEAEKTVNNDVIIVDIQELKFLNSSGIRMLATLFTQTSKKIEIHLNQNIPWQKVGILPLSHIRDEGDIKII